MDLVISRTPEEDVVRYIARVAAELGLASDSVCVELGEPASAYLALAGRLRDWPGHDVALLWDEENGWSLAVEVDRGLLLLILYRLPGAPTPPPSVVARQVSLMIDEPGRSARHLDATAHHGDGVQL